MITNNLLNQVAAAPQLTGSPSRAATPAETTASFSSFLQDAIDSVAAQEHAVHRTTDKFIIGQADISELMIVSEQAQLGLQLTLQIRNKVVEAYQEIMRMQV